MTSATPVKSALKTWAIPVAAACIGFFGGVLLPLPHTDGGPLLDINDALSLGVGAGLSGFLVQLYLRMGRVEEALAKSQTYNRTLWAYCRALLDMYYLHRKPGSPDPAPLPDEG